MKGLTLAYHTIVHPIPEYCSILIRASAVQLSKLDCMKHFAEQLCSTHFIPLERHCHTSVIGIFFTLLDETC